MLYLLNIYLFVAMATIDAVPVTYVNLEVM
jgi:hypothetical protein